jgi:hypothetical protein
VSVGILKPLCGNEQTLKLSCGGSGRQALADEPEALAEEVEAVVEAVMEEAAGVVAGAYPRSRYYST